MAEIKDPITGKVVGSKFVNGLPPKVWRILVCPVDTTEEAMIVENGIGKKVRLYSPEYTHYLIHYDSGKPGTKGCIGTQDGTATLILMERITQILRMQKEILVFVNVPPEFPEDKKTEAVVIKKETLKTKSFWIGLAGLVGGIGLVVTGDTKEGIAAIWAGLAMIAGRDAISKIK
jgi:hypothetical protein